VCCRIFWKDEIFDPRKTSADTNFFKSAHMSEKTLRRHSVLQCVAVRCSAYCSVLQCVAVCCSVLQCVAVYNSVLQCVAACCSAKNVANDWECIVPLYREQLWGFPAAFFPRQTARCDARPPIFVYAICSVCVYICIRFYMYICIRIYKNVCIHIYIYISMYMHSHICIYMYIYIYIYMYIYIYI